MFNRTLFLWVLTILSAIGSVVGAGTSVMSFYFMADLEKARLEREADAAAKPLPPPAPLPSPPPPAPVPTFPKCVRIIPEANGVVRLVYEDCQ